MGLLSDGSPLDDAQAKKLMESVAVGDLATTVYEFTDPADYGRLAVELKGREDLISTIVNGETGVADMNTNFASAQLVRKRTKKVGDLLRNPPANLADWVLTAPGVGGVMTCAEADIDTTPVTLSDIRSYLRIRDAYLQREIRAAWALALLKKKGKI